MPKGSVPRNIFNAQYVAKRRMNELNKAYVKPTPKKLRPSFKEAAESIDKYSDAMAYGTFWAGPSKSKKWTTRKSRLPAARLKYFENWGLDPRYELGKTGKDVKAGRAALKPIPKTARPKSSAKKGTK